MFRLQHQPGRADERHAADGLRRRFHDTLRLSTAAVVTQGYQPGYRRHLRCHRQCPDDRHRPSPLPARKVNTGLSSFIPPSFVCAVVGGSWTSSSSPPAVRRGVAADDFELPPRRRPARLPSSTASWRICARLLPSPDLSPDISHESLPSLSLHMVSFSGCGSGFSFPAVFSCTRGPHR